LYKGGWGIDWFEFEFGFGFGFRCVMKVRNKEGDIKTEEVVGIDQE